MFFKLFPYALEAAVVKSYETVELAKDSLYYQSNETYYAQVTIRGLKDPLYIHNGHENIIIERAAATGWKATTKPWDPKTTYEMLANRTYRHTNISPSFLYRLQNISNASDCCGIESLINGSFPNLEYSYVDYLYFNKTDFCTPSFLTNFTEVSDKPEGLGFKLEPAHNTLYNLSLANITKICD